MRDISHLKKMIRDLRVVIKKAESIIIQLEQRIDEIKKEEQ